MSADITSAVTILTNVTMVSYEIDWSAGATPVGSIVVEVSNSYSIDADGSVRNSGSWTQLTLSAATNVSGNTGSGVIQLSDMAVYAVRIRYVRTSGSGTMNALVTAKVQ